MITFRTSQSWRIALRDTEAMGPGIEVTNASPCPDPIGLAPEFAKIRDLPRSLLDLLFARRRVVRVSVGPLGMDFWMTLQGLAPKADLATV
jgi:hypothetical protein